MATKKSKIEVLWAIHCQSVTVDQQTNAVSLFNVIEEVNANKTPITSPQLAGIVETIDFPSKTKIPLAHTLVVMVEREGGFGQDSDPAIKLRISNRDEEVVAENEFPLKPNKPTDTRIRTLMGFDGFVADKSGKYTYDIFTKSRGTEFEKKYSTSVAIKLHP